VLVEGVYLAVFGKSISLNSPVNRRLEMLEQGREPRGGAGTSSARRWASTWARRGASRFYSLSADKAQRANIAFTPEQLIMVMVGPDGRGLSSG
jgi:tight adherence protein B